MAEEVLVSLGATARRVRPRGSDSKPMDLRQTAEFPGAAKFRNGRFWRLADLEKFEAQFADRFGAREETAAA